MTKKVSYFHISSCLTSNVILDMSFDTYKKIKEPLFHEFLEREINASKVKQSDMAKELGYENANMIAIIKAGKSKLPIEKVPIMASILKVDPAFMLRKMLMEYDPAKLKIYDKFFGTLLTKNESVILDEIRRLSNNSDPSLGTISQKEKLEEFVKSMI